MTSQARLLWSCRRGMLELDVLLKNFVDNSYDSLTEEKKQIFYTLLTYEDQVLFELFMGKIQDDNMEVNALVQSIRTAPGLTDKTR